MAFKNLDGVQADVDVTVDVDGAGATAAVSIKCATRFISTDMQQDSFIYDTFCSGTDEESRLGKTRTVFNILGFVNSGSTYSKPGSLRNLPAAALLLFQYDTGCTISGLPRVASDRNDIQANGESARAIQGKFSGPVTVAWVVA